MPADAFYVSSYGGVRIWCSRVSTKNGRTLTIHDLTQGDEHPVQDKGLETRIASCSLLFDDMDGVSTSPKERFDEFCALVEDGEPQIFTHPLRGSYLATVGKFDHTIDENSVISAEVEFVPVERIPAVTLAAAGTTAVAGEGAVNAAADRADAELLAVGAASSAPAAARDAVAGWQDDTTPQARRVAVDVGRISSSIAADIELLGLARNIKLWPAHVALVLLADAVLAAGRAATAEVARVMTVRVGRRVSLRTLLASIYGGREVDERYTQVLGLNDVRTPAWLEPGIDLRLPQPPAQRRAG